MNKVIALDLDVLEVATVLLVDLHGLFTDLFGFEPGCIRSFDDHCWASKFTQNCKALLVTEAKNGRTSEAEVTTGESPFVTDFSGTTDLEKISLIRTVLCYRLLALKTVFVP